MVTLGAMQARVNVIKPERLQVGDKVHLVSPASTPRAGAVEATVAYLEDLGLRVVVGEHALDVHGYFAGTDADRLADLNGALRDPEAKAIVATGGGKGAYRIADKIDFAAALASPKLLVGFSEISLLHLALLRRCNIAGLHGAAWSDDFSEASAESFRRAVFTTEEVRVEVRSSELTAALTTEGSATGPLVGGNQDMVATGEGWALPDLSGAILLLEDVGKGLGHIDRQLSRLIKVGALAKVAGIAVGQYVGLSLIHISEPTRPY